MELFFWLLVGHGLADYPLQGDFLARGKNHKSPIPGIPWYQCLFWHSLIQGGMVALITGSVLLGVLETIAHAITDYTKSEGKISLNEDQYIHISFKAIWALLIILKIVVIQ